MQDGHDLDLDLCYVVSDIFKDRDSANPTSSIVKVIQQPSTRESSVPPQSALRPRQFALAGNKRPRTGAPIDGWQAQRPYIKEEQYQPGQPRGQGQRAAKRPRLQEIQLSASPELDADRALPSQEGDTPEIVSATAYDQGIFAATPQRLRAEHNRAYCVQIPSGLGTTADQHLSRSWSWTH